MPRKRSDKTPLIKNSHITNYACHCEEHKCNNSALPHFGMCTGCYLVDKTPKERREFWIILSKHFNGN